MKTIDRAAQLAQPGDTVLVHAGVYRERVAPAHGGTPERPIVYTAVPGEQVVIRGSDLWQPTWRNTSDVLPIYTGALDAEMFRTQRLHPYRTRLLGMPATKRLTLGQVFVDGKPLREVDNSSELLSQSATWMVEEGGQELTIHFPPGIDSPDNGVVEVTTRPRIFAPYRRGLGCIHVRGFTMEHCANQFPEEFWQSDSAQAGALGCRAGHHWLIEGNTIRFAKSIGLDCGYEGRRDLEGTQPTPQNTGYHLIRNNLITDNGCCGIAGMRSIGTQIVGNTIERNNSNLHSSPEAAGIKVHYFIDGLIAGNLVRDNDACGIWLDNVYRNARVRQNLVIGNRGAAIFIELGNGPVLIDHNVLANSRPEFYAKDPRADGLSTLDASGVLFVHNLVFGCERFGSSHRKITNRSNAGVSRIELKNNLFINNHAAQLDWPHPGPDAIDNHAEHNRFSPKGSYLLNPWGGASAAEVTSALATDSGTRSALVNDIPKLNLETWQRLDARGNHNVELDSADARISEDLILTIDLGRSARQAPAIAIDQVQQDFFDHPLPPQDPLAGPFQQLTDGLHRLPLWPIRR